MNKKQIVALTSIMAGIMMGCTVYASSLDLSGIEADEHPISSVAEGYLRDGDLSKGIFDTGSTDVVQIGDDGSYTVQVDELQTTLYPPFGWLCFTQDVSSQLDDYMMVFNDPIAVAQEMVEDDIHYSLLSSDFRMNAEILIYKDSLSQLVGSLNDLSEADMNTVSEYLITQNPGYGAEAITINGQRYFKITGADNRGAVYETFVQGNHVSVFVIVLDDSGLEDMDYQDIEYMLNDFSVA